MFRIRPNPGLAGVALQIAALLGASAIAGAVAFRLHPTPPELYLVREAPAEGEVNMQQVLEMEKSTGVLWIDARVREQHELEHIPGSLLLNTENFDTLAFEHLSAFEENTKPIVIYCDAQKCAASKKIAQRLEEMGLSMDNEVHVLRGGWNAWKSSQDK